MTTFHDRLTTLDQKLDRYTQEKKTAPKTKDMEEQATRLEALEAIEEEQQHILHEMGVDLYAAQELADRNIVVGLDHQERLTELEASGEQAEELQKIKQQQTLLMREQKQELWF